MSSISLLLWIASGIVLQLALFLGIAFWRHWQEYQGLRRRATESSLPPASPVADDESDSPAPAWSGFRGFRVERKVFEDAARSVCSFYLVPDDGQPLPAFRPGQFLTFRLDLARADGSSEQLVRCYSLSAAPRPDAYRVSIKRVAAPAGSDHPAGRSSSYFHDRIEVGSRLQVRAPAGHFHLDRGTAPVVLIGGGIGITPMLSMLECCLAEQPGREIWLFYGIRNGGELVMQQHLEALAAAHPDFRLRLCFSDPQGDDIAPGGQRLRGRIDVTLLRMQLPLRPYHFYICGPAPMMESLVPALEDWGVPDARIHFEAFGPASVRRRKTPAAPAGAASAPTGEAMAASDIVVTFARSGRQLPWQPESGSLLEFAEANGVTVESGCRAGGCGSCQTSIRSGEVGYRQVPDFDPEPGNCLLCVCTPKTSVTLEA